MTTPAENPPREHALEKTIQGEAGAVMTVEFVVSMEYTFTAERLSFQGDTFGFILKDVVFDGKKIFPALFSKDDPWRQLEKPKRLRVAQISVRFEYAMPLVITIHGNAVDVPRVHIRKDTSTVVKKHKIKSYGPVCEATMRPIDSLTDSGLESNCMECRAPLMIGELGQKGCAPREGTTWEPDEPLRDADGKIYEREKP